MTGRLSDPVLDEALVLYGAWTLLVQHLTLGGDPTTVSPRVVHERALEADHERLAALVFAHSGDATMSEATQILDDVLAYAAAGRRPRYLNQIEAGA